MSSSPDEDDPGRERQQPVKSHLSVEIDDRSASSDDEDEERRRSRARRYSRNRDLPEDERVYYTDSDDEDANSGAAKVEAAQAVWGQTSRWFLFLGIGMSAYIYSLDSSTTYQYLYFATSTVLKHSLSGTLTTAQAIIIAVGKPLMAKLADVIGRAETFILVTVLYIIGYVIIASAHHIDQIALGEIIYAFGYTGLQILQQIVIADMTTLRYRGLVTGLISAPFIINQFVAAEILERVLPNWRWGYLMFAILVPISLTPLVLALLWGQYQAKKRSARAYRPKALRTWKEKVRGVCTEMDLLGLCLIASCLALILLPLGLAPTVNGGWSNPSMPAMVVVGLAMLPLFVYYEYRFPRAPVLPMRWLRKGPILGSCLIGFFDFASFYLQGTYLYSYVYVTRSSWNYRTISYFTATQMMTMTIFGIIGGLFMAATKRFKYMLFTGLMIRLLGVILMIDARSATGTTVQLVSCQVLQGIGGGFASIAVQVSAQAAVPHIDVATVTAMVLLVTEVGNSVGSALASGVWATYMPMELKRHVPTTNQTLLDDLFGSIMDITLYPVNDPIRVGAVTAYQAVMYRLVFGAIVLALFPPIACLVFTHDVRLTRAQNAVDNRDLAGRATGEIADPEEQVSSLRLHLGASPARPMPHLRHDSDGPSGEHGESGVGHKTRRASGWTLRDLEESLEQADEEGLLMGAPRALLQGTR